LFLLSVCGGLWWGPLKHPLPFPLISIRFANVFACFGCFGLLVFAVFGKVFRGHTPPFLLISIRYVCYLAEENQKARFYPPNPAENTKKRTPKADRSEPAPGPNDRFLPESTKRQGFICSPPAPSAEAAPRFAIWPAPGPNCL